MESHYLLLIQLSTKAITNYYHTRPLPESYWRSISKFGVAESGDDFTKFSTISQWFQTLIHPALMQHPKLF
ncbi:MAG: hypothetical protein HRU34_22780 [Richelia sp.]|nr:hypothetical protein [Richelia sp.]CDN16495.1 hypothetical protein RintRC_1719 [Richelia intracellularis]